MNLNSFSIEIISEGITDQVILANLLQYFFKNQDVEIKPLQPSNKHERGGWNKVLKYCSSDRFSKACKKKNTLIVIQIDTDCCQDFGVNRKKPDGTDKSIVELAEDVKIILINKINAIENEPNVYETYKDKIFFAICVEEIECWLLPFLVPENQPKNAIKTTGCINTLNNHLDGFTISKDKKDPEYHILIFKKYGKKFKKAEETKFYTQESAKIFFESFRAFAGGLG